VNTHVVDRRVGKRLQNLPTFSSHLDGLRRDAESIRITESGPIPAGFDAQKGITATQPPSLPTLAGINVPPLAIHSLTSGTDAHRETITCPAGMVPCAAPSPRGMAQ
jgi:hypothetical protein